MKNRIGAGPILVLFSLVLVVSLSVVPSFATDRTQDDPTSLMQMKLTNAQKLLEAMVMEDYEDIAERAKALHQISIEADWSSVNSKVYGNYGEAFRKAATNVETKAIEQDLDGVAWNYMQMIVTCVECHQAMRGSQPTEITMLLDRSALPGSVEAEFSSARN